MVKGVTEHRRQNLNSELRFRLKFGSCIHRFAICMALGKSLIHSFIIYLFRDRERESTRACARAGEGQKEKKRENPKQALCCQ